MRFLLALFIAASVAAQQLPKDIYNAPHRLNHAKYSVVEFKDRVVLMDTSFLSGIFNRDVRQRINWKDLVTVTVDNNPVSNWHGKLLNVPGCVGTQENNPQREFYFEDRSLEGMTIRGKGGMVIKFRCMGFALKENE